MDRVFSVDEIPEQFWASPPSSSKEPSQMNRSASEWAFQRFLQESSSPPSSSSVSASGPSAENDVVELKVPIDDPKPTPAPPAPATSLDPPPNVPIDSEEYQAFLKSRLNLACAAVALSRVIILILNIIIIIISFCSFESLWFPRNERKARKMVESCACVLFMYLFISVAFGFGTIRLGAVKILSFMSFDFSLFQKKVENGA